MSIFKKENYSNNNSLINEAQGLELLRTNLKNLDENHIKIPNVFSVSKNLLEMEKIDISTPTSTQMEQLGISLANLHNLKFENFGFEHDNFIGLGIQKNVLTNNWGDFFVELRLKQQVLMIKDDKLRKELFNILEIKRDSLCSFLNENVNHASLVHGDLWSGNVIFNSKDIYLIDPSIHYADSEVDIAMTKMFGGFDSNFYKAYESRRRLTSNYKSKEIIYNLYHYLNHYNLFGSSYLNSVLSAFQVLLKI